MAEEKAQFVPVKTGLDSDPKFGIEQGKISDVLRAFYKHTQPVVEEFVATRKLVSEFQANPDVTTNEGKESMIKDLDKLTNRVISVNHAERAIRQMPHDENEAVRGLHYAKESAVKMVNDKRNNPDDAKAAEIELKLLREL